MKAHKIDMLYAWAKENGVRGYEHLNPVNIAKARQKAVSSKNQEDRKKLNKTLTQRDRSR